MEQDGIENMEEDPQEAVPKFTVKAATYDFWNLVET